MTSTSSEPGRAARRSPARLGARTPSPPTCATARWTRFGGAAVLGDAATEATLRGLAERGARAPPVPRASRPAGPRAARAAQARSRAPTRRPSGLAEHGAESPAPAEVAAADALARAAAGCRGEPRRTLHARSPAQAVDLALRARRGGARPRARARRPTRRATRSAARWSALPASAGSVRAAAPRRPRRARPRRCSQDRPVTVAPDAGARPRRRGRRDRRPARRRRPSPARWRGSGRCCGR